MNRKTFSKAVCWVFVAGLLAMSAAAEGTLAAGAKLLEQRCSRCHDLRRVEKRRQSYSRQQWTHTVERMIAKGTELTDAEQDVLLDYLSPRNK